MTIKELFSTGKRSAELDGDALGANVGGEAVPAGTSAESDVVSGDDDTEGSATGEG